ncbi:MAG: hypothetical protein GXO03_00375 [Aquificae bacterium]|nr:hypothetical protein [Aquificota bacterium]
MRYFLISALIALAGLMVGGGTASYLTYNKLIRQFQNIPGSPIILTAVYDKEKHILLYTITNPGTTPLTIVEKALVFTPGKESKEQAYILSNIPANVVLPPLSTVVVELKLKAETEELKPGDVVVATFTYQHPLSDDLYTVVHTFEHGPKEQKTEQQGQKEEAK